MSDIDTIFCPTCGEFILDVAVCPSCAWRRPLTIIAPGSQIWRAELGQSLAKPHCFGVLSAGRYVLPSEAGLLHAVDIATGTPAWRYKLDEHSSTYALGSDGERVFVGPVDSRAVPMSSHAVLGINGQSGELLWRFDAGAHSYSSPAVDDGKVFVTASNNQIYALDTVSGAQHWASPHIDWGPASLTAAAGIVVAGGRANTLVAYNTATGHERWRYSAGGWFASRPAIGDGFLAAACWDGTLYVLDTASGRLRWQLRGERSRGFTSPPAIAGDLLLIGDRLNNNSGGGYGLRALRLSDGVEVWRFFTEHYVSALPVADADLVLFGAENGKFYALDRASGAERWIFETATAPVGVPLPSDNMALLADRNGVAYAVGLRDQRLGNQSPAALLASGKAESAAIAYAKAGDLARAAAIYVDLGQPRKAAQIFEHLGQPASAAPLWDDAGETQRARASYRAAGDLRGLAAHLARASELLEAARQYEEIGQIAEAAQLYEQSGDKARAADLYRRAGNYADSRRVAASLGMWEQQAADLIADGYLPEAAEILAQNGQLERAADLFEQAGKYTDALGLRLDLGHWQHVADLSAQLGDLGHAALAYAEMGDHQRAAEAYLRVAERVASTPNPDDRIVADHYERAAQHFEAIFDADQAAMCDHEVRRYRHLPLLRAEIRVDQAFVEQQWNTLAVEIFNEGFGPARSISVRQPERFDLSSASVLAGLAPQRQANIRISLRPQQGEVGSQVPLTLVVTYLDQQERPHEAAVQTFVPVGSRDSGPVKATPTSIKPPSSVGVRAPSIEVRRPSQPTPVDDAEGDDLPLTLRFVPRDDAVEIRWESDTIGEDVSQFTPPYRGADLTLVVRALDLLQHPTASLTADEVARLEQLGISILGGMVGPKAHQTVGRALYRALVADSRGAVALSTMRNVAIRDGKALALRLRFPVEAVELAALPWELLWDEGTSPLLLSRNQLGGCTRHLDLAVALPRPRPRSGPLRILAVVPHVAVDDAVREQERADRMAAWGKLIERGEVVMDEVSPVTRRALVDRIQEGPQPDIIHFVGHGRYVGGQGYLMLDGPTGRPDPVPVGTLNSLFGGARLVVLTACQGAMVGDSGLLTGVAPALSAAGVSAVVAMQLTVRIDAATRFNEVMYRHIVNGESLQRAVVLARQALHFEEPDGASWYVPTLTIRARDPGPLYLFDSQ
jgi:outer membrane protein assembly factor BamB/tetratricopeptide (TPR) repeat protein